ncbi:pyridoxal phosphate-dependent aminotransferase [Methylobacterium nodulans]|uniref:Aminotransferase n=1 Tax=Methylobacterium nodulans (strain LMG 21967 / CNCM I-2342 / ORS 2060) TaxID=460265 RepID=B8IVZ8_METNO|nr:pyridoxal phosphate-dependent aminotransferase [Methylobacterium nodulans]ACL62588.1 aminotransferase class I and II [Methylobacterium nodulans ORS 2060]
MNAPLQTGPVFRPAARLASIEVSEILRITAEASARKRAGRPVIVLGAGEPDFDTPEPVKTAAARAMREGRTKYTILDGAPELKAAVREKFRRDNGLDYALDEITCGTGAKQVLYNAFMASLDPGDEVVIPAPFWTSYADIVAICGGVPIIVPCAETDGFRLTPQALERAIGPRTRWLLLNSPSNPTGSAYTADDLVGLAEVLDRHPHVWLMSDDMYEHILYDGRRFATPASAAPQLRLRTLTVNGVSKAYAMTGWRIGYGAGPKALIQAMATVQSQSTSCPSSISQAAALEALVGDQASISDRRVAFQRRRDLVVEALNAMPGLSCRRPEGAFYTFANCAGLLGRTTPDGTVLEDDRAFCRHLLESADVAVVPGSCFGLAGFFRISYATSEAELTEACGRIRTACAALA